MMTKLSLVMTRKWYSIDDSPEPSDCFHSYTNKPYKGDSNQPFLRVHYGRMPVDQQTRLLKKLNSQYEKQQAVNRSLNPLTEYYYNKMEMEYQMALRWRKDPRNQHLSMEDLIYMASAYSDPAWKPVVIQRPTTEYVETIETESSAHDRQIEKNAEEGKLEVNYFDRKFANWVKRERLKKSWIQPNLANRLNVPLNTIKQLEKCKLAYDGKLKNKLVSLLA